MRRTAAMVPWLAAVSVIAAACSPNEPPGPKVVAHRGFWNASAEVPHNSVAALENAIALGCFGTEFDVWLTSDGIPVIHHDRQTSGGAVVIPSATYSELMESGGTPANGERIATLDEYLAAWEKSDRKVKLIFEIKSHGSPERDRAAVRRVAGTVEAHGIKPYQMEYIAFSREVCRALTEMNDVATERGYGQIVPVAYLNGDLSPARAREQLGVTGIDYSAGVLKKHPEWVADAHGLGMTVNVWTVNDEADMRHFTDAGVDYITTDRPDVLTSILSGK